MVFPHGASDSSVFCPCRSSMGSFYLKNHLSRDKWRNGVPEFSLFDVVAIQAEDEDFVISGAIEYPNVLTGLLAFFGHCHSFLGGKVLSQ